MERSRILTIKNLKSIKITVPIAEEILKNLILKSLKNERNINTHLSRVHARTILRKLKFFLQLSITYVEITRGYNLIEIYARSFFDIKL